MAKQNDEWSDRDEQILKEMVYRRQQFQIKTLNCPQQKLLKIIEEVFTPLSKARMPFVLKMFMNNAERLRDALAPFDKRVTQPPEN